MRPDPRRLADDGQIYVDDPSTLRRNQSGGVLEEDLIDTGRESAAAIAALRHTPGGAFGSCRVKLKSLEADRAKYERLLAVLKAHDVRYFLYNGGNDSADTAWKVSQLAQAFDYPLTCIGVPKTVDNDLAVTDTCPGFGSAAKYTAVSVREAALDVAAMAETSTKVFVYEAMGRHAGWLAAAAGLAGQSPDDAPHIILFPERAYDETQFLAQVKKVVDRVGWCVVVASEGIQHADGRFVADAGGGKDSFGHTQLGGVASYLAGRVKDQLGLKVHWTLPDYLQRSARHIASKTDWEQAQAVGVQPRGLLEQHELARTAHAGDRTPPLNSQMALRQIAMHHLDDRVDPGLPRPALSSSASTLKSSTRLSGSSAPSSGGSRFASSKWKSRVPARAASRPSARCRRPASR
mgnify:CR=1 FL=1